MPLATLRPLPARVFDVQLYERCRRLSRTGGRSMLSTACLAPVAAACGQTTDPVGVPCSSMLGRIGAVRAKCSHDDAVCTGTFLRHKIWRYALRCSNDRPTCSIEECVILAMTHQTRCLPSKRTSSHPGPPEQGDDERNVLTLRSGDYALGAVSWWDTYGSSQMTPWNIPAMNRVNSCFLLGGIVLLSSRGPLSPSVP